MNEECNFWIMSFQCTSVRKKINQDLEDNTNIFGVKHLTDCRIQ